MGVGFTKWCWFVAENNELIYKMVLSFFWNCYLIDSMMIEPHTMVLKIPGNLKIAPQNGFKHICYHMVFDCFSSKIHFKTILQGASNHSVVGLGSSTFWHPQPHRMNSKGDSWRSGPWCRTSRLCTWGYWGIHGTRFTWYLERGWISMNFTVNDHGISWYTIFLDALPVVTQLLVNCLNITIHYWITLQ